MKITYEPAGHKAIYAETQFGHLFKSFPVGDDFRAISPEQARGQRRNWSTPYVFAPNSVAVLYYGTHSLYRSPTRGTIWERISPKLTRDWPNNGGFGTITTIGVAPTFPGAIVVGTDDGHVWFTSNEGADWHDASAGLPGRWVTRVAFDPEDPSQAYATLSGLKWRDPMSHVFRTDDFGESWIDISGKLPDAPVNAFAIDPIDPRVLYVGTDVGAFVHFNRGEPTSSWEILGEGLPAVAIYDVKVNAEPHFLVAGTHGRSMYKLELSGIVTSNEHGLPDGLPTAFYLDGNYPNPFSTSTTIRFGLTNSADVTVDVFDLSGRRIATILEGRIAAGVQEISWNGTSESGSAVAAGTYLYRIATSDGRIGETGTMSLIR